MQLTDGPRGQRYGAGRRAISPTSRCAIVGRNLTFRKAREVGDCCIKKCGDLRESAGQVCGATLGRAKAAGDQGEEPATNNRNGVERIPRLGLHLVQFEADRANGAERQIAIAEIVGAKA